MNTDIAWAAGLFEGEGCISMTRDKRCPNGNLKLSLAVAMSDEDVVRRMQRVMGFGSVTGPYFRPGNKAHHKPAWHWSIGTFEHVQAGIAMMWNHLGARRRARAAEVLRAYTATYAPPDRWATRRRIK